MHKAKRMPWENNLISNAEVQAGQHSTFFRNLGKKCYKKIFIGQIKPEITLLKIIRAWKSRGFNKNIEYSEWEKVLKKYIEKVILIVVENTHIPYIFSYILSLFVMGQLVKSSPSVLLFSHRMSSKPVSYTHLTLPTIYSV